MTVTMKLVYFIMKMVLLMILIIAIIMTIEMKIMTIPGYISLSTCPTAQHNPPWTRGSNNSGFVGRLMMMMMMIDRSIMMMTNTYL